MEVIEKEEGVFVMVPIEFFKQRLTKREQVAATIMSGMFANNDDNIHPSQYQDVAERAVKAMNELLLACRNQAI